MRIQSYIFPKWKEEIEDQQLPNDLEHKFLSSGESMAEYLDRFMMRSIPESWYRGWTRYKFPLKTNELVLELHQIIGNNFEDYIDKYKQGKVDEFKISAESIEQYNELEQEYRKQIQEQEEKMQSLREQVKEKRKENERPDRKSRNRRKKQQKKSKKDVPEDISDNVKAEASSGIPDHDYVYDQWMEMVESKPISKSYWHIHEYLARYILTFVEENSDDGKVTKELIDAFLEDYGEGKRPKTMNHYRRVIYRFLEFYENLLENENPMEVW